MKSPADLAVQLRRQWADTSRRLRQLLSEDGAWPVELPIPLPSSSLLEGDLQAVREHVQAWRAVRMGRVVWAARRYRSTADAVELPRAWQLRTPSEWVAAMQDAAIGREFARLGRLAALPAVQARPDWLAVLIRQRHLLENSAEDDVARAITLAAQLSPGCAAGLPLRALPFAGIDGKLWERQRTLLTLLLQSQHPGQLDQGLEHFLGAQTPGTHWLDVVDLDGGLLPWPVLRVRSHDLARHGPPGDALLLVENHQCLHHLPPAGELPCTVAILGAGLNLAWLRADWLQGRAVAYWGDIDTWGLTMLAQARQHLPQLTALCMDAATRQHFIDQAGAEPVPATVMPQGLLAHEQALFDQLLAQPDKARIEQERLPVAWARDAIRRWRAGGADGAASGRHSR
ncbi:DUF3322 domain-containing protein [Ottowia testudinis]|uniref:DUF3322 and DUF2220 domain-containing protein n=1 Tax=Ottowia testudinis TaxID=2816950 RepID=A0A975CJU4_9BURK|nr:Wadjet anti-phage system protein JetD domain-containing protein [Ottowia testudinis]QTD47082.1 hypothetical protein J1M35_09560 [Ottowia testudinis]